jgi:hypothetical protein
MSGKAKLNRRIKPSQLRVQCAVLGAMRKHGDPKSCDFVSSRSRRSHSILYESENVERCRQIISTYIRGADTDWPWAMRCIECHSVGSFPEIHMSYTVTHRKSMKIHSFVRQRTWSSVALRPCSSLKTHHILQQDMTVLSVLHNFQLLRTCVDTKQHVM